MRVVTYARVSTDRQVQNDISIPDQIERLRKYCKENDWLIVGEFTDLGITAGTDRRPQFQDMMLFATQEENHVSVILSYSLNRLFRNYKDLLRYYLKLEDIEVRIRFVTEHFDDTPYGLLMMMMTGVNAQQKLVEDAGHTARAMRKNAENGYFNGSQPPFGYRRMITDLPARSGYKKLIIKDDAEAALVLKIYDLYEFGEGGHRLGIKNIVKYLNDRGLFRRGSRWTIVSLHKVLSDEVYTGVFRYGARSKPSKNVRRYASIGEPVEVSFPVIIPKDRFQRVAVQRHERSPRKNPPRCTTPATLLSGLIKCGYCGNAMVVVTGKGGRYSYLKCTRRLKVANKACASPSIPREALELAVLNIIVDDVLTTEKLKIIVDDCRRNVSSVQLAETAAMKDLTDSQGKIERRLARLCTLVEEGQITDAGYATRRLKGLERELAEISVKLDAMKVKIALPENIWPDEAIPEFALRIRALLANPLDPMSKAFLHLLVSEVRVYAEEATVTGPVLGVFQAAVESTRAPPASSPEVPRFISNWRARRDSNSRPPGS